MTAQLLKGIENVFELIKSQAEDIDISISKTAKSDIFEYMKETAKGVDSSIIKTLEQIKDPYLKEITSHLPLLRTDIKRGVPKTRSTLGRLIYESFCDEDWRNITPILSFIELAAISTYVLDDIIDEQPQRDGKESTWNKYGINEGIISGSLHTFLGNELLFNLNIDNKNKIKILYLMNDMWKQLWIGEGENEFMKEGTSLEKYLDRSYKICGVMYDYVAQMGAIAADVNEDKIILASEIGKNCGIATMVRNDLMNLIPQKIIKDKGSKALSRVSYEDVRKGVYTYPIIYAMENCNDIEKFKLKKILGNKNAKDEELIEFTNILLRCGAIDSTLNLITEYKENTLRNINKLRKSGWEAKDYLIQLANLLENTRDYVKRLT